jgi:hypothetical protein
VTSFFVLFAAARLRRRSGSWREYEAGKHLLAGLPADEYEKGIRELAEYLGI